MFVGCIRKRGPMPSADEIRDVQRATWAGLSAGWEKWDSVIMDQLGPVSAAMIERLDIADDQQHLDIAAGTGEPGLSIARLAPKGREGAVDKALYERGKAVAAKSRCANCHSADYRGREQMPRLAAQREDFLAEAMFAYQQNRRPGGDTIMAASLYGISGADIKALAHYLSRLR